MKRPTPDTDDEASVMTLDCDDSCVEIYIKRHRQYVEGDFVLGDFARKLERERDEARELAQELSSRIEQVLLCKSGTHGWVVGNLHYAAKQAEASIVKASQILP